MRHQGTKEVKKRSGHLVMVVSFFAWPTRVASVPHGVSAFRSLDPRQESAPQVATGGRSTAARIFFREASRFCRASTQVASQAQNRTEDPHWKPRLASYRSDLVSLPTLCMVVRQKSTPRSTPARPHADTQTHTCTNQWYVGACVRLSATLARRQQPYGSHSSLARRSL